MLEMLEKIHELSIIMTFPKKLPDGWLLIRTNHNGAFGGGYYIRPKKKRSQHAIHLRFTIWEIPALARELGEPVRSGILETMVR